MQAPDALRIRRERRGKRVCNLMKPTNCIVVNGDIVSHCFSFHIHTSRGTMLSSGRVVENVRLCRLAVNINSINPMAIPAAPAMTVFVGNLRHGANWQSDISSMYCAITSPMTVKVPAANVPP